MCVLPVDDFSGYFYGKHDMVTHCRSDDGSASKTVPLHQTSSGSRLVLEGLVLHVYLITNTNIVYTLYVDPRLCY